MRIKQVGVFLFFFKSKQNLGISFLQNDQEIKPWPAIPCPGVTSNSLLQNEQLQSSSTTLYI